MGKRDHLHVRVLSYEAFTLPKTAWMALAQGDGNSPAEGVLVRAANPVAPLSPASYVSSDGPFEHTLLRSGRNRSECMSVQ